MYFATIRDIYIREIDRPKSYFVMFEPIYGEFNLVDCYLGYPVPKSSKSRVLTIIT